jgi:predicted outer membrane repeat protein
MNTLKRLSALIIVLIVLSTFSGVYAVNSDVNNKISAPNIIDFINNILPNKIIYVVTNGSYDNDGLTPEHPKASIEDALDIAKSGDTIQVAEGIYYETLHINKNITLIGNNQNGTFIEGEYTENCVNILENNEVIIKDLTIRNGKTKHSGGGGINNQGSLTLQNILITNNTANNGGGIYNKGILTLQNTKITDNTAEYNGGGIYNVGILNKDNTTSIINNKPSDIEFNIMYVATTGDDVNDGLTPQTAKKHIKAALNELDHDGVVKLAPGMYHENNIVINSYVTIEGDGANNTVIDGKKGQVFYVNASSQCESEVIFKDLTIENAKARYSGSAIDNQVYDVIIKNCNFNNNEGGCIENNGGMTIENCIFERNQGSAILNYGDMKIKDSKFHNNYGENGGAIDNIDRLSISNCIFICNKAGIDYLDEYRTFNGGAIYNNGALDVKDSIFDSNRSDNMGGAIYSADSLYVENCKFLFNIADYGGAITAINYSHKDYLIIDNNEFTENQANTYGGAIYKTKTGTIGINKFTKNTPENIKIVDDY